MKKRVFVICLPVVLLIFGIIFLSCENFLENEDITEQIEKDIYIANNVCPVASVEEPAFSDTGVAKNKAIVVRFSKAIKPESFINSYSITDSSGNDLKANFLEPQWANENTLVTLAANEQNLIDLKGKKTLDIYFALSTSCVTPDDLPIEKAVNHRYRITDTIDNTAPEINDNSYAERAAIYYLNNLLSDSASLIEGAITADNESNICNTNHINSKINFYIEGSDYGGGSVKGHVAAKRIKDSLGNAVYEEVKDFIFELTKKTDSDNSSGSYTVDLSSTLDYQDGLYELKAYVQDASGLDSEQCKTYYVIRDTALAYCITSRLVNDTPLFRDESEIPIPTLADANNNQWYLEYLERSRIFNIQTPTLSKINDFRTRIFFDKINDDAYYTSPLTHKTYAEDDLIYFVSWGLDKEHMTSPEKIEGKVYPDNNNITPDGNLKYYTLPAAFNDFLNQNEASDIILKATVLDCVGNQSEIYSLWPKKIDFYNYTVEDDNEKKKVTLNFSTLAVNDTFEDKKIHGKYRIFYAPLGTHNADDDLSDLLLKRNCAEYIPNSDESDLLEIKGLELNSKYVVYVQTAYDSDSIYNGQYTATTFGPVKKIIVDTDKQSGGTPLKPAFTITKKGGEKNSGLYTLGINISDSTYDSNVKYIPYYWDVIKLEYWAEEPVGSDNWVHHPDTWGWLKLESHTEKSFNITVNNQLKAPLKKNLDENGYVIDDGSGAWVCDEWDYTELENGSKPDNNYFQAVENCKDIDYTPVTTRVKLIAVNDTDFCESDEVSFDFSKEDDTIPPTISSKIIRHDSHLSYDGHSFEFTDLIREDEGNLTEYFTYYYAPYNPAWGDNLNVLSEDQIKGLPCGRAPYTGSTWFELDPAREPKEAAYRLDTSIPVFGLPDGDYMYFARLDDRYGNYTYATLGKAHIGTFKNKLKVKLDEDGKYFISTLELEPEERFFDRNMINVQVCWDTGWANYYDWLNELQNCTKETIDGKLCLKSYIADPNDTNIFVYRTEGTNYTPDVYTTYPLPKDYNNHSLNKSLTQGWYRITMQSFNEKSMTAEGSDGVSYKYGRPYTSMSNTSESEADKQTENYKNLWNRELWYVDGEQKYDACTDETVSNTVYYYVPWTSGNDKENFSDYFASFFSATATPRSNHSLLVNVFASYRDLGNDPDEWERRGKLVATHRYLPDSNGVVDCDFDQNVAAEDVSKAREQGLVYYAAVVHFAKGESAVSDVYTMYGF